MLSRNRCSRCPLRTHTEKAYSRRKWKWHSHHFTCRRVARQRRYRYPCLLYRHDDISPIAISLHDNFRQQDRHNSVFRSNVTCVRGEKHRNSYEGWDSSRSFAVILIVLPFPRSELLFRSRYFGS